jgi:hypothetical protein
VLVRLHDIGWSSEIHLLHPKQQRRPVQSLRRLHPRNRTTLPADSAEPVCARLEDIGVERCLPRRMVFVGGLQRSGTSTLAALLSGLPGTSGLRFEPRSATHMGAAPWKRLIDTHTGTWMKWA